MSSYERLKLRSLRRDPSKRARRIFLAVTSIRFNSLLKRNPRSGCLCFDIPTESGSYPLWLPISAISVDHVNRIIEVRETILGLKEKQVGQTFLRHDRSIHPI